MKNNGKKGLKTLVFCFLKDILFYVAGSFLYAVSVNTFTSPNSVSGGGVTGIAIILNSLFGSPIGFTALILNIPLFVWGYFRMGFGFIKKSAVATFLSTVIIDMSAPFLPRYTSDVLLACIFGGIFSGLGLSIIFLRDSSTGGSDLAAGILKSYKPNISVGRFIFLLDGIVVLFSGFAFKNIENALYATIVIFISSRLIDVILYGTGSGNGKVVFIVSEKSEILAKEINNTLGRGVTFLSGMGSYSRKNMKIIMCALYRREFFKIERLALKTDPKCFIIAAEAEDIRGKGFTEQL